jgi:hypothetical protein
MFKDCSSYNPKVMEGAPNGTPVIKASQSRVAWFKLKPCFLLKNIGLSQ